MITSRAEENRGDGAYYTVAKVCVPIVAHIGKTSIRKMLHLGTQVPVPITTK